MSKKKIEPKKEIERRGGRRRILEVDPQIQDQMIKLLQGGVTEKDMCHTLGIGVSTFYTWLKLGEQGNEDYRPFYELIMKARAAARVTATVALRRGFTETETTSESNEVFEETRVDKNGTPYNYRKTTRRLTKTQNPPDWRAALEYLKRRDPAEWGDKMRIEVIGRAERFAEKLNVSFEQLLTAMLDELEESWDQP